MQASGLAPPSMAGFKRLGLADRLIRRNILFYAPLCRELDALEAFAPDALRRWRRARIERMLRAARATEYGRRLGSAGPLEEWPLLDKETVRDRGRDFLTASALLAVEGSTSGTSGLPLRLKRSFVSVVYEQVMFDRLLERAGLDAVHCRAAVLRGDDVKPLADRSPPYWTIANHGLRLIFSTNHLDGATIEAFASELRAYRPDALLAYPSALESLCALLLERGIELSIPVTVCASEVLTRATAQLARDALRTRVIGHYGLAERVAWAQGDPALGYRFDPTYSANELRFVEREEDADVYELIGTGLWNRAMPLVRYRTGDRIRVTRGADPRAVAEGREPFLEIVGRSGDYLVAPSGARLIAINHIPRGVPHVVRTQFVQESPERVTLLVVPGPGFGEESLRVLRAHAALKLPPDMSLTIETTTRLERNASGKAPLVLRKM